MQMVSTQLSFDLSSSLVAVIKIFLETIKITSARLFGALIKSLPLNAISNILIRFVSCLLLSYFLCSLNFLRQQVLSPQISNSSVLNLNSVLLESPGLLLAEYSLETTAIICQGIRSKIVSFSLKRIVT